MKKNTMNAMQIANLKVVTKVRAGAVGKEEMKK